MIVFDHMIVIRKLGAQKPVLIEWQRLESGNSQNYSIIIMEL